MIGRVVGALVGREIDRRHGANGGGSGVKGALLGAVAVGALRRLGPLGLILGGAYVAKQALDRRKEPRAG